MRSFFSSRLFIFFAFLCFLIAIFMAALPSVVSTEWGRKQVVAWINRSIPGQIEIRSLNLHWGKGQVLEGILLKDPEGQSVLGIEKFTTDATLLQLLRKSTRLGYTHLQELNAAIVADDRGISNLQRALGLDKEGDHPRLPPSTILLSDVNGTIALFADGNPLAARLTGTTRQDHLAGNFEVDITLPGLYANNWEELTHDAQKYLSIDGSKDANMHAKIVNFPVDLLDRLLALKRPDLNTLFHSLFGDRLNLVINKVPSQEGLAFNLNASSPLMQGDVKGKISKGIFTLQEPAAFNFGLKPDAITPFTHYHFELSEATTLKFLFQDIHLPLAFLDSEAQIDSCQFGFKAQAELLPAMLEIPPVGEVKILSLKTLLESPLCHSTISVQVIGQGQQEQEKFNIHFESLFSKPTHARNLKDQLRQNMELSLKASHLPLKLISALENYPSIIKQAGSFADLQLSLKQKGMDDLALTVSMHTPQIVLNQAQFKIGNGLTLMAPLNLSWIFAPDCLQTLFSSDQFALDEPCPVLLTVRRLQLPLDVQSKGRIQIESTVKLVQFSHLTSLGSVQLKDILLKIDGESLSEFQTQLTSQLSFLKSDGFYSPLLNRPVQFNLASTIKIDADERVDFPSISLQMQNSSFKTELEGRLTNQRIFVLSRPFQMQYQMTPEALQELNLSYNLDLPTLQIPSTVNFITEPTQFDLKTQNLASLIAKGRFTVDRVEAQKNNALLTFEQLILNWSVNASQNSALFDLKTLAYADSNRQKPSQINAKLHLNHWLSTEYQVNFEHAKAEIATDFKQLPTAFVSLVFNQKDLSPLIGPSIDLDLKTLIDRDQQAPAYWDMYIDSGFFHAKTRLKIDRAITLYESTNPSGEMRWTLTPEGYRYLYSLLASESKTQLTLAEPVSLVGSLTNLYIPLPFSLAAAEKGQIAFQFNTTPIQWKELPMLSPVKVEGKVESSNLAEEFLFSLRSSSKDSSVSIDGKLAQFFDANGKLRNWQQASLMTNVQARKLPAQWVQTLLFLNEKDLNRIQALLGDTIEADFNIQLQQLSGPVQGHISGVNGYAKINGMFKQGILTLQDPLEWQIRVTPLLGRSMLEGSMPILSTAIDSEKPLTLYIDPAGFSCQLLPFEFSKLSIEKGIIDLGKIRFRNEGELRSILSFIRPIAEDQFTIWFTPLYFQLNKGQLSLKRLDLLVANQYTLASWGDIDLNTQKMNLVLGLSAQSLRYAFNIQGLDQNYFLQIPIKGRKGHIEIDKKRAAGRISALVAQLHGDPKAKLLGNVLEAAMSNQFDPTPPAPTTQPFPWIHEFKDSTSEQESAAELSVPQGEKDNSSENIKSVKEKKKKLKDLNANDLIKGLEEGASGLLEKLIK
ncbi:conserved putative membrane protein [Candidatus Protochlamydia naegleriophila]|uniref:Conserved putative membrane protein n=2 Tax=Candidatus Protochlamydia naegleriophila TaxID=389348 RepID=A0A0U5ERN0_9BACT|nr:conserved putative membrane protein [Candidatus Protochlamydia naegleriophila]